MTDTSRTLKITRTIAAPRAAVWRCWSEGDLLKQWYSPKPWTVSVADIDVRAGGKSHIVMNGPEGDQVNTIHGQYLEVVDGVSQTFTDAFVGDWMPGPAVPFMVGYVILSDTPDGNTHMEWGARHWSVEAFEQHKAMGFEFGWNAAADQLDALAASL
jgi:uncharacterized protein YndB with AHSA1/START domain